MAPLGAAAGREVGLGRLTFGFATLGAGALGFAALGALALAGFAALTFAVALDLAAGTAGLLFLRGVGRRLLSAAMSDHPPRSPGA